ncbi:unnamed protein product [Bursaphelenchus okinawaensis]|uniref:Ell-associated factor Eaf n=1 Tax=Bursaphelenchus okinawaensis TaxID=465554 RepID=A0A811JVA3_9BILA|nr:unnamed protein product [Bursaphelenchus okinawaensis]CAG9085473.1 unnamed protein product [Bursaphelenchus okinawaensis]
MMEVGPSGLPLGTYELKIGQSFGKSRKNSDYHTLRYDFKPKSIGGETETFVAIKDNDDVQIAIASEGRDDITMYKGSKKPIKDGKECLLIFNETTGEMRLEKIASNINVKQTRKADDDADKVLREEVTRLRKTKPGKPKKSKPIEEEDEPESSKPSPPELTPIPQSSTPLSPPKSHKSREKRASECKKHDDAHMSSSSESSDSSSDSSDSSDESDGEESTKRAKEVAKRQRPESSNFSSDDEAALEKHLNASGPASTMSSQPASSSKSTPKDSTNPIKSQQQVDELFSDMDMPNLQPVQPAPVQKTQPVPKKMEKHSQMLLQNDLDLSESSDED